MQIDLNQIEAMTTNELEAHYGRLETEAFRLKVALSVVSVELEARIKSRRITPLGVEEQTTNGETRLSIHPNPAPRFRNLKVRAVRSDKGVPRGPRGPLTGSRSMDHSSCCGAEGRRMNTETLDCAACRGDAQ